MPYYNMNSPADWAALQYGQRNDNFQNLVNLVSSLMKWKQDRETQQSQFGQELELKKSSEENTRKYQERTAKADEARAAGYVESIKNKPESAMDRRWRVADEMEAAGTWTPEEANEYKLTGKISKKRTANFPKSYLDFLKKEGLDPNAMSNEEHGTYLKTWDSLRTQKPEKPEKPEKTPESLLPQIQQQKFIDSLINDLIQEWGVEKASGNLGENAGGEIKAKIDKLRKYRTDLTKGPLDEAAWGDVQGIASNKKSPGIIEKAGKAIFDALANQAKKAPAAKAPNVPKEFAESARRNNIPEDQIEKEWKEYLAKQKR